LSVKTGSVPALTGSRKAKGPDMNELAIVAVLSGVISALTYLWGYNIGKRGVRRDEKERIWDEGHEEGFWDAFRAPGGYVASRAWSRHVRKVSNPYRKPGGEGARNGM
jgi:hypothetical protein